MPKRAWHPTDFTWVPGAYPSALRDFVGMSSACLPLEIVLRWLERDDLPWIGCFSPHASDVDEILSFSRFGSYVLSSAWHYGQ